MPLGAAPAAGFDAGIACALDLIPRDAQRLAARLHAAYTPEAVAQVCAEAGEMEPQAPTSWWLAACSVCREGEADAATFISQIAEFEALAADASARHDAALREHAAMLGRFELRGDGLPVAHEDGGMQGAYLAGHQVAAMWAQALGLWFVGTFAPTLGLKDFPWAEPADPDAEDADARMGRSGPVHGSRQFVKCADRDELERVVTALRTGGLLATP